MGQSGTPFPIYTKQISASPGHVAKRLFESFLIVVDSKKKTKESRKLGTHETRVFK